ncbi:putative nucleoporin p58/p45 [Plasmopara halstedii]
MAFSFSSTTSAPSSGFTFGSTPAASPGFSFTNTSSTPSTFNFSATPSAPTTSSGLNFGTIPTSTPSTTFPFGVSSAPVSTSSFFGQSTPSTGCNFGATTTSTVGPPITLETVFEALPDDVKKNMTQFYAFLKEQDHSDTFLKTVSSRQLELLRQNIARLEQEVLARRNEQNRQIAAVQHVRQDVRHLLHQVDTATLTRRSLENSASGPSNMYHVMRQIEMPSPYYWDLVDHYEHKMARIKAQIEELEAQFKPINNEQKAIAPNQLQQILLAQNTALMHAAAHVAEVHDKAEELRQIFLTKIRDEFARHGEKNLAAFQNPFDKRKKSSEAEKQKAIDTFRFRTTVAPTIVTSQPPPTAPGGFGFGTTTTSCAPTSGLNFGTDAPAKTVSFNLPSTSSAIGTPLTVGVSAPTSAFGSTFSSTSDKTVTTGKRNSRKMRK